jgi:hypothetical protein
MKTSFWARASESVLLCKMCFGFGRFTTLWTIPSGHTMCPNCDSPDIYGDYRLDLRWPSNVQ